MQHLGCGLVILLTNTCVILRRETLGLQLSKFIASRL